MSLRSRQVSQTFKILSLSHLLRISGMVIALKQCDKNSINFHIILGTTERIGIPTNVYIVSKISLDFGPSASIVQIDFLHNYNKFFIQKIFYGLPWQGL